MPKSLGVSRTWSAHPGQQGGEKKEQLEKGAGGGGKKGLAEKTREIDHLDRG
jgi:hypothetical protein